MNLLASAVKSASYDELRSLAVHIAHACGDADPDGPGAREGMPPTERDLIEAIHEWATWAVSQEKVQ